MLFSSAGGCKPEGREESEREELPILIETEKQVTIAKGVHPVPCRTRKLSPSAPMVLRFASRESRSLPVSLFFPEKSIQGINHIQFRRGTGDHCEGVHPVPCRTRKLSPSAPMVLRFASRESRSLPVPLLFLSWCSGLPYGSLFYCAECRASLRKISSGILSIIVE